MGNQPALRVSMKDMSGAALNVSQPVKSDRESSIEKQVCLKCAVELAVAGKILIEDIVAKAMDLHVMFEPNPPTHTPAQYKEDDFEDEIPF